MRVRSVVFATSLVVVLTGCPKKDDDTPPPVATATAAPTAAPVVPADVKTAAPAGLAVEPRVKAELDNRADGAPGTALSAAGATASIDMPAGWQTTKGDVTVATSGGMQLGVTAAPGNSASGKLPGALAAMGLASCTWNAPETVTVGKTKLASSAADGVCTRGTTQVRAAWVAPSAESLLVVGAWDPSADGAAIFGSMRSIAKASGGGDPSGIAACCSALRQNAKSAPPQQQGMMMMAAGACDALRNNPQGRAALAQVRGMLAGMNVPSSCR